MVLSEGGSPLSAGQKQLAALARALLKHSKAALAEHFVAHFPGTLPTLTALLLSPKQSRGVYLPSVHRGLEAHCMLLLTRCLCLCVAARLSELQSHGSSIAYLIRVPSCSGPIHIDRRS